MNGEVLFLLPQLHGAHTATEVRGDFFPRLENVTVGREAGERIRHGRFPKRCSIVRRGARNSAQEKQLRAVSLAGLRARADRACMRILLMVSLR